MKSWFYVEAYQTAPFWALLRSTGPWFETPERAGQVMVGMCVSERGRNPSATIGVRCLRWTGSGWVKCGFLTFPCSEVA
jgi:hypothetical protein